MHAPSAHAASAVSADGFLPHGYCFLWDRPLLLTHLVSDLLIGTAYVVISFALATLVHRARRDIPFSVAFIAFGLFIVTCGMTHYMEAWTLWHPDYWLSGGVKVVTAIASVATAAAMPFMVPRVQTTIRDAKLTRERAVETVRNETLEQANAELTRLNRSLQAALASAEEARLSAEQAKRVAEDANAVKGKFLAMMSHELRTPLNAVIGYTQLLTMGLSGPLTDMQVEQLARIHGSAAHLVGIIDQVLHFARLEAGKHELLVERIDAVEIAREAAVIISPLANAKDLPLHLELPDGPVAMRTDAQKLRQILLNLLSNAIKYTERGGVEVRIAAAHADADRASPDGRIAFQVRDSGAGIPAEQLAHIFDPFWQGSSVLTRTVGGTGLGLSVSRQLAILLGGELAVESSPGAGSTFTLVLPAEPPSIGH